MQQGYLLALGAGVHDELRDALDTFRRRHARAAELVHLPLVSPRTARRPGCLLRAHRRFC